MKTKLKFQLAGLITLGVIFIGWVSLYKFVLSVPVQTATPVDSAVLNEALSSVAFSAAVQNYREDQTGLPESRGTVAGFPMIVRQMSHRTGSNTVVTLQREDRLMSGAYFDTAGNRFVSVGNERVDCTVNGRSVTIKWTALGGGNPAQWFYDESGFGVIVDICGPLRFAKFSYDGRRIYEKDFGQHAHSWGILAPRSRRLCVIECQHGKGISTVVHVFDWTTGKQLKMVILREHEADIMAIDKDERYLYIGKRGGSAERAEL